MKLLFDANLSPRLVSLVGDLFPESEHVYQLHEESAEDKQIWNYALQHGFTIVTKDADFDEMRTISQVGPGIIWIRRGNCSTNEIADILRKNAASILAMASVDSSLTVLVLL